MLRHLLIVSSLLACILHCQSPRIIADRSVIVARDSVIVGFNVVDDNGQPIQTLQRSDVALQDNQVPVSNFDLQYGPAAHRAGVRIVLVLDASGSMRYDHKIERLKQAAIDVIHGMKAKDRCAIIRFSSKPTLLTDFTDDQSLLVTKVRNITAGGSTAIYDAVFAALNLFDNQAADAGKVVLLVSDGQEEGKSLFALTDIAPKILQTQNLTINTFDLNAPNSVDELKRLALLSGGSYLYDRQESMVFTGFSTFLETYRKEYVLSFKFDNDAGQRFHNILVSLAIGRVQQTFSAKYAADDVAGASLFQWESTLYYAGGIGLTLLGIAGAFVMVRKRLGTRSFVHPSPNNGNAATLFGSVRPMVTDERTRILGQNSIGTEEKTVLLEIPKRNVSVLGYLLIEGPSMNRYRFEMDSTELIIGRSSQCKVHLEDPSVSRLHAKIRLEKESFLLYDLGSANGTTVNGEEIQKYALKSGDTIEVGKYQLVYTGIEDDH
jgi:VWFA-related protein